MRRARASMMIGLPILLCAFVAADAAAQSLAQRVTLREGTVQVIYAARPGACGDGESFIGNVFNQSTYYSGNSTFSGDGSRYRRPCIHGPARVVATVISGEVTRLRPYVGPVPPSDMRTLNASPAEATGWLDDIIERGSARLASEAMLPLVLADAPDPWPFLLRVARDDNRPTGVRRAALTWLANGVNEKLGIADAHANTDDDEVRQQAVFALSQRPRSESVPELIDIARSARNAAARRSAIFWLGQTGDRRAADVYAELLRLRE